ncbi:MAG: polysaccharide biosynthesis protein [Erysipelotrichaceae bacterium]|nr:polysaccharide biosynthesis protein [Erysipelotrichaceae bacterium]
MFDLDSFVANYVTHRQCSMFCDDIKNNEEKLKEKIQDKSVLVIGGAGSIGSNFIKAILPFKPSKLVVVDTNENGLAELVRDIRSTEGLYVPNDLLTYPMDYSSKVFEKMFINNNGFDIVANFSAHKHVRSEKDIYSIEALIRNNVINAKKLLDLLTVFPPENYFCVSTDKAANPVNIMGASKRIMEDLIFSYSDKFPVKTARFANVAFSNGSLPAGFLARMNKLQPLSAPSDVKRYFVSLQESGQICMLACILGKNREIFFPKLEEAQMMSFDKIGEALITENGYSILKCNSDEEAIEKAKYIKETNQYPIHISVSNTSGEKAYEEFYTDEETYNTELYKSLGFITDKKIPDVDKVKKLLFDLENAFDDNNCNKEEIVSILSDYLPNFQHIETGKSLDTKM